MPESDHPYRMTIGLNVLNQLGISLYSSVPAVLGEAVANSYDADATQVDITIDKPSGLIKIADDGMGMDKDDINLRYLHVGYERRKEKGQAVTPKGRDVMGRKGIGKLSLFSVANIIEIRTVKNSQKNGFRMNAEKIKQKIASGGEASQYFPDVIPPNTITITKGTEITLSSLKTESVYETSLRKRLARRFTVIGQEKNFSVFINKSELTLEDRGYFKKIQYLWHYGPDKYSAKCSKLERTFERDNKIGLDDYTVKGWIGTVENSGDLKEDEDNLNKILVLVRGKVAQEDMLEQYAEGGVYSKYLVGELNADFLDLDDKYDITTSSRQKIFEDDPRYQALKKWLYGELKEIQTKWTDLRREGGEQKALESDTIKEWYRKLSPDNRTAAKKMFGKINAEAIGSDERIRELFKYGVIAFESLAAREDLTELEMMKPNDLEAFSRMFSSLDEIEAVLYRQIVEKRLGVIDALQEKVDKNDLEKVIQRHLFDHLWMLDTSWERATEGEPIMEKRIAEAFGKIDAGLTKEEKESRLDIKYRVSSGKHIIIELKRGGRILHSSEIVTQVQKYHSAIYKILESTALGNPPIPDPFEIVVVIGKPLAEWPTSKIADTGALKNYQARVVEYDQLIRGAQAGYKQYFEKKSKAHEVLDLIQKLETESLHS